MRNLTAWCVNHLHRLPHELNATMSQLIAAIVACSLVDGDAAKGDDAPLTGEDAEAFLRQLQTAG